MADNYCPICRKSTPHKSIMRRSQTQSLTKWQEVVSLFVKGTHYYEMECQQYCRVCNHQNQLSSLPSRREHEHHVVSHSS